MSSTQLQHAWYEMTRARTLSSVALVPIEEGAQTLVLAQELANLAARDPRARVLVINATGTPVVRAQGSADKAPTLPGREMFNQDGIIAVNGGRFGLLDLASKNLDEATVGLVEVPRYTEARRLGQGPYTLILVATNSPLTRPNAVSSARAAEQAVLCVRLGESSFANARRCLELIGEQNVIGSLALR